MKKRFDPTLLFALTTTAMATVPACGGESLSRNDSAGSGESPGSGGTSAPTGGSSGDRGGSSGHVGGTTGTGGRPSAGNGGGSVTVGGTGSGTAGTGPSRGGAGGQSTAGSNSGGRRPGNGGSSATSTGGGTSVGGINATGGTKGGAGANEGGTTNGGIGGNAGSSGHAGTRGGAGAGAGGQVSTGGNGGTIGSAGTAGGAGTSAGTGCAPSGNRTLVPSPTGWVDHQDVCNDVGVQGAWYPYGDQYGSGPYDRVCLVNGQHQPSECAVITTPDPNGIGFPNMNGLMTTAGVIERILPCVAGSPAATIPTDGCPGGGLAGGYDYSSMWGAGIAFDLNRDAGPPDGDGKRNTWDPYAYGVVGIQFTIMGLPPSGLRVEFPMLLTAVEAAEDTPPITAMPPTTDEHSRGAPYWGAKPDGKYPNSPVVEGVNTITWDTVGVPVAGVYTFDVQRILGIKFHLQASTAGSASYSFTISNLTFLRHL